MKATKDTLEMDMNETMISKTLEWIEKINNELGFPKSVYKKIAGSRALDGVQSETYNGFMVTWQVYLAGSNNSKNLSIGYYRD